MEDEHLGSKVTESLLRSGWTIRLRVAGWSMKPILRPGCRVRIVPADGVPRVGEIVLYRSGGGRLVLHRVVGSTSDSIWTKGDACRQLDARVDPGQIVGRALAVESPFRFSLATPFGRRLGRLLGRVYPELVRLKTSSLRLCRVFSFQGISR